MKSHVLEHKAGRKKAATNVPTMNFTWVSGQGVKTSFTLKRLQFNANDLKGTLNQDGYLLPIGYQI